MNRLRIAAPLLLCFAGAAHAGTPPVTVPAEELDALLAAYALVKTQYVAPADGKKLLGAAIDGMLASLDPHSHYLDKEALAELEKDRTGEYTGIGIEVDVEDGQMHVVAVSDGTPADMAGIEAGDTIVSVDGASIAGMRPAEVARCMRGAPGSALAIGYRRGGAGALRSAALTRAALKAVTVRTRAAAPGVAWIRVSEFEGKTSAELATALKALDAKGRPRGIVLDLRNNPGGLVSAAVGVAGAFLPPESVLFSARGRTQGANATVTVDPRYYRGRDESDVLDGLPLWTRSVPLTVLVNGASASSAELVAGALQDNGRAKVFGTRSFGKGSIQTVFPLTADTAVKMTVARYFTPSGKEIQATGITPDVVVAPVRGRSGSDGLALREEDLAHHLETTLAAPAQAAPATRAPVESTRIFGTGDDKALAAAVAQLSTDGAAAGGPGAILRKLALQLKLARAMPASL
jgi:carboxyl-terminal processing protease